MKKEPKISIIVPIYNAEKYIERCLKSIYAQTFQDYEIILVNDGSKDRSSEICHAFQEKDARIHVIDKENGGAGSARNAGMEVASGEYLAFPDVDDWFQPEMYEELYNLAKTKDFDVAFSGVNYYKQKEDMEVEYSRSAYCEKTEFLTQESCRENIMSYFPTSTIFDVPWNKLYKRSIVVNNNVIFTDLRRCQDAMFNLDFYNHVSRAVSTNKAYYNYMENTTEGVQRKFPKNYIDINVTYFEHLIELLTEWGIYQGEVKKHYDTSYVIAVYETMGMYENPLWNLNQREKKQYVLDIMNKKEVQKFLKAAEVREDVSIQLNILREKKVNRFFCEQRIEKIKEQLRKNELLMKIYHVIKR